MTINEDELVSIEMIQFMPWRASFVGRPGAACFAARVPACRVPKPAGHC